MSFRTKEVSHENRHKTIQHCHLTSQDLLHEFLVKTPQNAEVCPFCVDFHVSRWMSFLQTFHGLFLRSKTCQHVQIATIIPANKLILMCPYTVWLSSDSSARKESWIWQRISETNTRRRSFLHRLPTGHVNVAAFCGFKSNNHWRISERVVTAPFAKCFFWPLSNSKNFPYQILHRVCVFSIAKPLDVGLVFHEPSHQLDVYPRF